MIAVFSNQLFHDYTSRNQTKMVIYDINKNTAIDLIDGHSTTFIADTNLISDFSLITFHISSNRGDLKINNNNVQSYSINNSDEDKLPIIHQQHVAYYDKSIQFYGKRILILNDLDQLDDAANSGRLDYLVLSDNIKVKIKELNSKYNFRLLVIDGSNSATHNKNWVQQCKDTNTPFYSIIKLKAIVPLTCDNPKE